MFLSKQSFKASFRHYQKPIVAMNQCSNIVAKSKYIGLLSRNQVVCSTKTCARSGLWASYTTFIEPFLNNHGDILYVIFTV